MTVEEKRTEIERFCNGGGCDGCPLYERSKSLSACFSDISTEDLDINYSILFGNGRTASTESPENDPVNRPSHYTDGKIEVIEFIEDKKLGFCLGNAVKYISRAGKKDPTKEIEDLNKAKWYIERRIKELEEARS